MKKIATALFTVISTIAMFILVGSMFLWVSRITDGETVRVIDKAQIASPFPRFFLYVESEDMQTFPVEVTKGEYHSYEMGDKYELAFR